MTSKYCSAPDTGLFVSVMGQVGLCCSGAQPLGNIRQEPIQDIFKKPNVIRIMNNIKSSTGDSYCQGCDSIESTAPGSSQRSAFNDQFKSSSSRKIQLADIRWSNVCNLSCRYCNTHDSSEWRRLHGIPIETVNRDYTDSLFSEIEKNKESIECLYLLGGEPLLQKHNERLLDIIDPSVKIDVLTNLSLRLDNNKVYQKLKKFPNVYWALSFDTVGQRFEYVRQGANWNLFTSNVNKLCEDFGPSHVTFHPVYSIWNSTNLIEYYDYASTGNFRVNWQLALPKVDAEYGLASDSFIVFGHNKRIIERSIQEIDKLGTRDNSLLGIKQSLEKDVEIPQRSQQFLDWTAKMEQFMPPAAPFSQLWPELNTLLC